MNLRVRATDDDQLLTETFGRPGEAAADLRLRPRTAMAALSGALSAHRLSRRGSHEYSRNGFTVGLSILLVGDFDQARFRHWHQDHDLGSSGELEITLTLWQARPSET